MEATERAAEQKEIAQTIMGQLGGNQFILLTGTKKVFISGNGVGIHIGQNPKRVTFVRVTLTDDDLYTIESVRVRKGEYTTLQSHAGVYADMLQDLFEEMTGLFVTFNRRR
jgi:hypothetical protein